MALKTTVEELKKILSELTHDLEKSLRGNKTASQRVRTNSIKFAKTAKVYRKESVEESRKSGGKKATPQPKKTTAKKTAKKTTSRKKR